MSLPISETIVENIVTTLAGVTTGNGYENTLTVEREEDPFNQPRDRLAIVCKGKLDARYPPPIGLDEYIFPIGILFYAVQSESDGPVTEQLYSIAADIRKALMVDVHRNGHAVNTEFETDDIDTKSSPPSGIVTAKITFRTLRGNPYQR
jgi:hypothetical protein